MKKATLGIIVISLLASSSCQNPGPPAGGTITFKSTTYDVRECHHTGGIVYATFGASDTGSGIISCVFDSSSLPLASGNYTIRRAPKSNHGLIIYIVSPDGRKNYVSTGGDGKQKISVTVGKNSISLSGTGIEMVSQSNDADSIPMNFDLTPTR